MFITKIERQKNDPKRYSVFIDGDFAFGLDGVDLLFYKLAEGGEIDGMGLKLIIDEAVYKKALDKALRALGSRLRSVYEIRERLCLSGAPDGVIDRVISTLMGCGYLNDGQFAAEYAESLRKKGRGARAIKHALRGKGIERGLIAETLENDEAGELEAEACLTALAKKYRCEIDGELRRKAFAFLSGRGFSTDVICAAIKRHNEEPRPY
jgi:regulatory protein